MEAEHRDHAVVEQVIADLKDQALAHFPSGQFNANGAWTVLACLAHNLLRWTQLLGLPDTTVRAARTLRRRLLARPRPPDPPRPRLDTAPSRPLALARRLPQRAGPRSARSPPRPDSAPRSPTSSRSIPPAPARPAPPTNTPKPPAKAIPHPQKPPHTARRRGTPLPTAPTPHFTPSNHPIGGSRLSRCTPSGFRARATSTGGRATSCSRQRSTCAGAPRRWQPSGAPCPRRSRAGGLPLRGGRRQRWRGEALRALRGGQGHARHLQLHVPAIAGRHAARACWRDGRAAARRDPVCVLHVDPRLARRRRRPPRPTAQPRRGREVGSAANPHLRARARLAKPAPALLAEQRLQPRLPSRKRGGRTRSPS